MTDKLSTTLAWTKIVCLGALTFAIAAGGIAILRTGSQIDKTIAGIGTDIHQSTTQLNSTTAQVSKSVDDTSKMLNANLIHLDLILGRTERISRKEESFWDQTSAKTLATLGHVDDLVVGLDTTSKSVASNLDYTSGHLNESLDTITSGLDGTLKQSTATLVTFDTSAASLNHLLNSPDIVGTLSNVQVSTKNIADTSEHIDHIANDLEGKTTQLMHPTKKKQVENVIMNFLNLSAHTGEAFYYFGH